MRERGAGLSFLDAAAAVLAASSEPLSPEEITHRAVDQRLLRTAGKSPSQTMKSKLSVDVLRNKARSRFKRTGPNLFTLRDRTDLPEFFADRFQKALLEEDIIVFKTSILRKFFPRNGITRLDPDLGQELLHNTFEVNRADAERRYDIVQLVSQFLVCHRGKLATHKRTRRLPESRLHGERSLLFGGHLNSNDIAPLFGPFDPVNGPHYITRELAEEVVITGGQPGLELVGGIYDPRRDVSKQHLGILYVVRVPESARIEIGERGFLQDLAFEDPDEIASRLDEYENWSELVHREFLATGEIVP